MQKDLKYEHTKGCKKVSRLLHQDEKVYEGVVCFDWSSYDTEDEIPSLCIDENIVMVEEFQVDKEGSEIIITSGDNRYTLDLKSYTEQENENMDLYKLLNDVYYETDYSWEIGDFEIEFLCVNRLILEIKDIRLSSLYFKHKRKLSIYPLVQG